MKNTYGTNLMSNFIWSQTYWYLKKQQWAITQGADIYESLAADDIICGQKQGDDANGSKDLTVTAQLRDTIICNVITRN